MPEAIAPASAPKAAPEAAAKTPAAKTAAAAPRVVPPPQTGSPPPTAPPTGPRSGQTPGQTPGQGADRPAPAVLPVAGAARLRRRHRAIMASFVLMVLLPAALAVAYLHLRAADQYTSTVGFAVRTQDSNPAIELLGGISSSLSGGSSSSDTDILYEFIRSQELVRRIDAALDLRAIWSRPAGRDPVFAFDPDGTIEDLLEYWRRMVRVFYNGGTGLIELRVHAFDPAEAQAIATAVFDESARMINELSAIARDDATRYAREELDAAVERLKLARQAMTAFRSETRIVDPTADIQGQMGLLNTLQQQLAASLIEIDLLRDNARDGDPRVTQTERRIEVIRARIEDEREKFGLGGGRAGSAGAGADGEDYATILAEFERLTVDREFAERAYTGALAAYDAAQAEARRTSRYLAAYVSPTLAEAPLYPQRAVLSALVIFFAGLAWSIAVLIWYAIRDRR